MSFSLTTTAALAAPLSLWAVAAVPDAWAQRFGPRMAVLTNALAWGAFGLSLVALLLHGFGSAESLTLVSFGLPFGIGAFTVGVYVDAVTVIMLALVSLVGAVVSTYSRNYMAGDAREGYFHKWLMLTLAAILTVLVASNLLMFSLAWMATSLCLHRLLVFYPERPAAVLAAHKKFVFSRIGDVSLFVASLLIGATLHTMEFPGVYAALAGQTGPLPGTLQTAAWLIVLAAVLKCAQFPFHGWILQLMEAPTPVSALLHAGIVNAGAFLVIRMSPVMSLSGPALDTLAVIGLVTLAIASLVMLTQTSIKVSLAWSTSAQMGFMLLEAGLGLYSLALLHLVAHSLYKAHAFLASGSGVDGFRAPVLPFGHGAPQGWHWLVAFQSALLMTLIAGFLFGIDPREQPALIVTGAVVAIATTQLLLQALVLEDNAKLLIRATAIVGFVCLAYFGLHTAFEHAIAGSVVPAQPASAAFEIAFGAGVVVVFVGLLLLQHLFTHLQGPLRQAIQVHLYNGLYVDILVTRLITRLWPAPKRSASASLG
ncbi:NADH-quinone oxidoreductase subunit L [Thiorhodovibrio frisius]|uniref:Probable inorganic carbon transporter subunit DabB n=1 Tax=Thiorhodovibrio frisius TaxID=631362 RepID=H8Z8C2_9GAMM|nr:NADH-quinone oxidoreductase subunit L [Thiorhodovibrio frisius]EIC21071.1 NADH:ubiquinone oxidoreductase subunit 5 (chain L)/multisubunit Na+/H+ antiporter, MnhA subunit [Thiorhodovibrio frisius]WPL22132.1 NADH-quinone oxidoreductase subunit L [Thiorhodovibrio frisius]